MGDWEDTYGREELKKQKQQKLKEFQRCVANLIGAKVGKDKIFYAKQREERSRNQHPVICGTAENLLKFLKSKPELMKHYFKIESTTRNGVWVRIGPWSVANLRCVGFEISVFTYMHLCR